jgi:hypothetical protein
MAKKNIFGLTPFTEEKEDEVQASIKSLEKQRENLDARLRAEGVDPDTLGGEFDNRNLLEKALNLTPDQGVLMDFFEILNRPVQAVKGALVSGYEGINPIQGALEGLAGKRKTTGREIVGGGEELDFGLPALNLLVDIGTDIALDPLTYVPAGFFTKGFKKLTTSTRTQAFKYAQMAQDKLIASLGKKPEEILPALKSLAEQLGDSRVFVFKKDVNGTFLDELVDFAKGKQVVIGKEKRTVQFAEGVTERLKQLVKVEDPLKIRQAVNAGDFYLTPAAKKLAKSGFVDGSESIARGAVYFKDRYAPLTKSLNYLEQRINTIAGGKLLAAGDGVSERTINSLIAEYGGFKKLNEMFKQFGPDIKVIATSTKSKIDDLVIVKRYADTDYWTRVGVLEAKYIGDLARTSDIGGFGKLLTLNITKAAGGTGADIIQVAAGSSATQEFRESFIRTIKGIRMKSGETLESFMLAKAKDRQLAEGARRLTNKTITNQLLNANESAKLKNLLYDFYKSQGMDVIYAQGKNGQGQFFRLTDVFEDLDLVSGTSLLLDKKGNVILKGGFKADLTKIAEKGKYLVGDDLVSMFIQKEMQITTTFLENLATKGGFTGATAQGLINVGKALGQAFDATFNFSEFGKKAYKFIIGESNQFVQQRSAQLTNLRNAAIKKHGPKAGSLIRELMEAGAYIDPSGAVRGMESTMHMEDFLGYIESMLNNGVDDIFIRNFGNQAAKDSFLNRLNKIIFENIDGDTPKFFDIVEQTVTTGGISKTVTKLKFNKNISAPEFLEIKKGILRTLQMTAESPFLDFGQIQVSAAAQNLLRVDGELVAKIQSLQDDILSTLAREGGFTDMLTELAGTQGYVRHIMTKGALEAAQTSGVGAISRLAKPGTDLFKGRKYMGTIEEINTAMKALFELDVDFFNTDIFDTMEDLIKVTSRKVEQHRILNMVLKQPDKYGKNLFRVVNNTAGIKKTLAPNEVMIKSLDDELPALFKNLSKESRDEVAKIMEKRLINQGNKAVIINRNALDLLKRAERAYKDIPQLIKFYDGFLNTWKGLTLITPGFHMRNLFGNMFNSYAVGMDLAAQGMYGTIAMQELNEYAGLVKKLVDGVKLTDAEQRVYDLVDGFTRQGLIQSHRGVRDLEQLKEMTEAAAKGGALKNTYNNAIRFNFNIAEKMDDVQRYMLYRWALDKTGDSAQAARTVTEALFDYTHLTGFEKDVMKRVFPFYTFMKNNFIFQAKNIFRNPKLYARTGRAYKYYLEDIAGYSPENLPDYTTENMWLPIPIQIKKTDKKAIAFLKANLPLSDFMEIVENPFKKGVVSIAAPLKLPIELGLGRDLFTGRKITAFPGQRNVLAKGSGVFNFLRDERGNLAITQMPIVQKIAAELGLRTPLNFGSVSLDILDTLLGYQGPQEGLADLASRMGLTGVQDMDRLKLTELYQDLEKLREIKKYYEQETGYQLPLLPRG